MSRNITLSPDEIKAFEIDEVVRAEMGIKEGGLISAKVRRALAEVPQDAIPYTAEEIAQRRASKATFHKVIDQLRAEYRARPTNGSPPSLFD